MNVRQKITPFLWFDTQAEQAADLYVSLFKNSKIVGVTRYGEAGKSLHDILGVMSGLWKSDRFTKYPILRKTMTEIAFDRHVLMFGDGSTFILAAGQHNFASGGKSQAFPTFQHPKIRVLRSGLSVEKLPRL